ncbi:MAG: hypothetical protein ACYC2H_04870 [Thermoplasmatota archaeon]
MSLKAIEVIFSDAAEAGEVALKKSKAKEAASIRRRIAYYRERLLADCLEGEVIPCPLPKKAKALEARHGPLANLYCCDLPDFWRLLYTIVRADGKPYVYVLEIVDHSDYDKWFPGKGR